VVIAGFHDRVLLQTARRSAIGCAGIKNKPLDKALKWSGELNPLRSEPGSKLDMHTM